MADLETNKVLSSEPRGQQGHLVASGVTLGVGALVQINAGGYVDHWDETGDFLGVVITGDFTNSTNKDLIVGDGSTIHASVDTSGKVLTHLASVGGTAAKADVGNLVYAADSDPDSLTDVDTTNPPVGWVSYWRSSTDVDVTLFTPAEWKAGVADGTWNT